MVTLTIDNRPVTVPEGTTILDAAKTVDIHIPTLCYLQEINEVAACRVCAVEVEGVDKLAAACNTQVEGGMVVLQVLFCRWKGRPLFAAAPLHRWLEKRGMSAVNIFYSLCALSVCGLALAVRLARWV